MRPASNDGDDHDHDRLVDHVEQLRQWMLRVYPGCRPLVCLLRLRDADGEIHEVLMPAIPRRRPGDAPTGPTHSSDYRTVTVRGETYSFSPSQASIVRQLWEAHDAGNPELGQETLLEGADSSGNSVRDLFKARGGVHLAWGTLILPGATRGTFRLDLDE